MWPATRRAFAVAEKTTAERLDFLESRVRAVEENQTAIASETAETRDRQNELRADFVALSSTIDSRLRAAADWASPNTKIAVAAFVLVALILRLT